MTKTPRLAILMLATMLAAPGTAASQAAGGARAQAKRQKAAQAHFEQGRQFFEYGAYDEAIHEYEAAYAALPLADFLFNIGQVYRTKGDRAMALTFYRRFLDMAPASQSASVARAHIAAIEAELAAQAEGERLRREAEDAAAQKRATEDAQRQQQSDDKARQAAKDAADDAVSRALADTGARSAARALRITGLAATTTGVVAGGVGLYLGLHANRLQDQASRAQVVWTDANEAQVRDAAGARKTMYILATSGALLTVGGAVLYYIGRRHYGERRPTATLTLMATSGGAGLALGGGF